MADKTVNLKLKAEADASDIKDLKKTLEEIEKDKNLKFIVDVSDEELGSLEEKLTTVRSRLSEMEADLKNLKLNPEVDDEQIKQLEKEYQNLKLVESKLSVIVDNAQLMRAEQEIKVLNTENPNIKINVHGEEVSYWKKEMDLLRGQEVWVECEVDGSDIENARRQVRSLNGTVIEFECNLEDQRLNILKKEVEELNNKPIDIKTENSDIERLEEELSEARYDAEELREELNHIKLTGDYGDLDDVTEELKEAEAEVKRLEGEIDKLKNKKLELKAEVEDTKLKETEQRAEKLDGKKVDIPVVTNDEQLNEDIVKTEKLDTENVNIPVKTEDMEVDETISKVEALDKEVVNIPVHTTGDVGASAGAGFSAIGNGAKKAGDEVEKLGDKSKKTGESIGMLSGAGSMMAGMVGFELAAGLAQAGRESINANSKFEYFADRLGMTKDEVSNFRSEVDAMQKDFRKVDMTAVGASAEEIIMKSNGALKPTSDNLREVTKMTATLSSAFINEGRTQEDAILAVNDALGGQFKRLQELNITQDALKKAGWSGDLNDQLGLVKAINKCMDDMGYSQTAKDITTLDDAFQALSVAGGQLLSSVLIPLTPLFLKITYGAIGFVDAIKGVVGVLQGQFGNLPQPFQELIQYLGLAGIGVVTFGLSLNALGSVASAIISPFSSLWNYFKVVPEGEELTPFRQRLESIKSTVNSVKDAFSNLWSNVSSFASKIKTSLMEAITPLKEYANTIKTTVVNAFNTLKTKALEVATSMKTTLLNGFRAIKNFMTAELIPALRNAGTALLTAGRNALTAGYNALASVASWVAKKAAMIADTIATYANAVAQWALNSALLANPITWVVVAIIALIAVLGYLYFNNEQVRNAINGLGQAFVQAGQIIYGAFMGAIEWVKGALNNLWNYIQTLGGLIPANASITGNAIIDAGLKVVLFLLSLPMQIGMIFINLIASALGFGDNFAQNLIKGATSAVDGFNVKFGELLGIVQSTLQGIADYILSVGGLLSSNIDITGNSIVDTILRVVLFVSTLPMQIAMFFTNIIASALGFGDNFAQTMITGGMNSVNGFIQQISQLPSRAGNYLNNLISRASSFVGTFVANLISGATNAVNGFINQIKSLPSKLQAEFDSMLNMARDFVVQIADILTGGGASMVIGWMTGSGEHSPGFMYDALQGELTAMVGLPMEVLSGLIGNISAIGMEMATALSEALFGINFDSVTQSIDWLMTTLIGLWDYITQLVALVPVTIQTLAMQVIASLQSILSSLSVLPSQIMAYLNQVITNASSFASRFVSQLLKAGNDASNQFINSIKGLAGKLSTELQNMLSVVDQWAATLPAKFWEAGVNAVKNFLSALGIKSPGIMQRTMAWEVTEMGKNVVNHGRTLVSNIGILGKEVVDAFGTPKLSITSDKSKLEFANGNVSNNNSPVNQTINLEIGSVDNEDRVNEIIEIIQRELHWNNLTAGRTVDTS